MAKQYDHESLRDVLRHTVGIKQPDLRDAPIRLAERDLPSPRPTALGVLVAEPDEDIDRLTLDIRK